MEKVENDLAIYYTLGNANIQRQKNEIALIIKFVIPQDVS